jgi:hypothetical protein
MNKCDGKFSEATAGTTRFQNPYIYEALEYSIIARAKRHSREREQIPDGR